MPAREDIAFAAPSALRRREASGSHVAHVDEIIPAAHAGRQPAVHIIAHHLHQMVALLVVRPEDARRMHDHRVEPRLRRIEHNLRRFRLGLGVAADDLLRREMPHLAQHAQLALLRNGVHRADVYQPPHVIFPAQRHDVARPGDVDLPHLRRHLAGNIDDARRMDDDDVIRLQPFEHRTQGRRVPHVALEELRPRRGRPLARQQEPPHLRARALQQPQQR